METTKEIVDQANAKVEMQTTLSGVGNMAKSISQNGLLIQTVSASGVTTNFNYDSHGRRTAVDGYDVSKTDYLYHSGTDLVSEARTYYATSAWFFHGHTLISTPSLRAPPRRHCCQPYTAIAA